MGVTPIKSKRQGRPGEPIREQRAMLQSGVARWTYRGFGGSDSRCRS